jgi:rRNA maturation RNase YbeY
MASVSIQNFTRRRTVPRVAFTKIVNAVLPGWDISLVFVGPTKARALNEQLRGKSYIPNVLSYTVGQMSGEIIICLSEAAKQAGAHGMSERNFVLYLFIHGALHIKGWVHGAKMEQCEQKLLIQYGTTHSHRHRHRHVPSKDGRRRRALR